MTYYISAIQTLIQPTYLILMLACSLIGIIFGAIPGLSAGLGVALALSMTFSMAPHMGLATLIGVWIGGVSGGFISATLVGIPGTPSSVATCFDAYPLSKKGETVRALGVGILASFVGTVGSIVIATFVSPLIANLAVKLGPWEYFSLCLCSLVLVSTLAKGNMFKGLAGACIGILLSCIGSSPIDGYLRFSYGNIYLSGGIDMVALMLGIFAIKQIVVDYARGQQEMPEVDVASLKGFNIPIKDFLQNKMNIFRSFMIGLWIGFLPGMGAGLSNMVAYAQAKSSSKTPEAFGEGCVDGIFASEVSNNAAVGGAVIPMIALGIPGDAVTALLLSGLMIHGLQPGPLLYINNPDTVYFIFAAVLFAAIFVFILQLFGMRFFPLMLKIPYAYLYSVIIIMCVVGAYVSTNTAFNILLTLCLAIVSLIIDIAGIAISPLILGFILGPMLESNFRKGMSYSADGFITFLTRPVSAILLLLAIFTLVWPILKPKLKRS